MRIMRSSDDWNNPQGCLSQQQYFPAAPKDMPLFLLWEYWQQPCWFQVIIFIVFSKYCCHKHSQDVVFKHAILNDMDIYLIIAQILDSMKHCNISVLLMKKARFQLYWRDFILRERALRTICMDCVENNQFQLFCFDIQFD